MDSKVSGTDPPSRPSTVIAEPFVPKPQGIHLFGADRGVYEILTGRRVVADGEVPTSSTPPLAAEFFSQDHGPIVSVESKLGNELVRSGSSSLKDGPHVEVSFLNQRPYKFRIDCLKEALRAVRVILVYIMRFGYIGALETFVLSYQTYNRDLVRFKRAYNYVTRLPNKAVAPWPGARKADLATFLRTHYARFLGKGLTMAWIWQHDRSLYNAIHYARQTGQFPDDIVIPSERDSLKSAIEKFLAGQDDLKSAGLSKKDRLAVNRKIRRVASLDT